MAREGDFVEIRLQRGSSVSGRVWDPSTPVAGAHVTLWNLASRNGNTIPVDEAGFFSFDRLRAGGYRLTAEATSGQTPPLDIVLRENEHLAGLALVIEHGAMLRGKISGILPRELPVVKLVAQGRGGFTAVASTEADGTYVIHGVPTGMAQVIAQTSSAQTSSYRMMSKSIEVGEGAQEVVLDIEFPSSSRLYGRVTRAGQPVLFETVIATPRDPQLTRGFRETEQDGTYEIEGLSDGDYVVSLVGRCARRRVHIAGNTILDIECSEPLVPDSRPNHSWRR